MLPGWTILFFIYAEDDSTEQYADALINDLRTANNSKDLTLLIFKSIYQPSGGIKGTLIELAPSGKSDTRITRLVKSYGEVNPGNTAVMVEVFTDMIEQELLREKFLLFTWDHGLGFGIFNGDPREDEDFSDLTLRRTLTLADKEPGRNLTNSKTQPTFSIMANSRFALDKMPTVLNIEQNEFPPRLSIPKKDPLINMLTIGEINEALEFLRDQRKKKTDLVIMMNCWMQTLEAGYELEEAVDILVAAETVHFFAGYDYESIINAAASPDATATELAEITVKTIKKKFQNSPFAIHLDEIVISATALGRFHQLKGAVENICQDLVENVDKKFINIQSTRNKCKDLTDGFLVDSNKQPDLLHFIDFHNYIGELAQKKLFRSELMGEFDKALDNYVFSKFVGEKFQKINPKSKRPLGSGVSIFHPTSDDGFDDLYYKYFYLEGRLKIAQTPWYKFLRAFEQKSPQKASTLSVSEGEGDIPCKINVVVDL